MWRVLAMIMTLALLAACDAVDAPVSADDQPVPSAGAAVHDATDPGKADPSPLVQGRLLFMHRSVGGNLLRSGDPDMYGVLAELNDRDGTAHRLWHHFTGSSPYWNRYYDADDEQVVPNFGPAFDENLYGSPEHWRRIFCDPDPQYVAARDSLGSFCVVAFKSGYDNTVPHAASQAAAWRACYRAIKNSPLLRDPGRRVVALGMPPIREGMLGATQADADSARAFSAWLLDFWPRGRGNLHAFDLYGALAGDDNWLRDIYERDAPNDSHPNLVGSTTVARALMTFLHEVALTGEHPADAPHPQSTP